MSAHEPERNIQTIYVGGVPYEIRVDYSRSHMGEHQAACGNPRTPPFMSGRIYLSVLLCGVSGQKETAETLLHEIVHAVDDQLVKQDKRKTRHSERWVTDFSAMLFGALWDSGLWRREHPIGQQLEIVYDSLALERTA